MPTGLFFIATCILQYVLTSETKCNTFIDVSVQWYLFHWKNKYRNILTQTSPVHHCGGQILGMCYKWNWNLFTPSYSLAYYGAAIFSLSEVLHRGIKNEQVPLLKNERSKYSGQQKYPILDHWHRYLCYTKCKTTAAQERSTETPQYDGLRHAKVSRTCLLHSDRAWIWEKEQRST